MDTRQFTHLQAVEINNFFVDLATMSTWLQPFNQATFFNYDPNASIWVNDHEIAANTFYSITLNAGEYNCTKFNFQNRSNSTTVKLEVVYSQYKNIQIPA